MPAACRAQKAQRRDLTCIAVGCRLMATRREHGQQNSTKQRYEPSSFYPRLFFVYRSTDDISKLPPNCNSWRSHSSTQVPSHGLTDLLIVRIRGFYRGASRIAHGINYFLRSTANAEAPDLSRFPLRDLQQGFLRTVAFVAVACLPRTVSAC